MELKRFPENPILRPNTANAFEAVAAFNPSVAASPDGKTFHLVYRALSKDENLHGAHLGVSRVGYASGTDPLRFGATRVLVEPTETWDKFGCEDPRVTFFEGKYYIFYTALSTFPFSADGIKIGVAVTRDFRTFEKHPVTPFNSKAMMLLPDRLDGKLAAILTVNTDRPPAKIALALFENESEIWSERYWNAWYAHLDDHIISLLRSSADQVEAGAAPVKTDAGWLFIYSYIKNYRAGWNRVFGIEAALLDLSDPRRVLGRTKSPLLVPEKEYERNGIVPTVVFPSGALISPNGKLLVYYGAADTSSAVAGIELGTLLEELQHGTIHVPRHPSEGNEFMRFLGNPILEPRAEFPFEARAVFNPAAIFEGGKVHIVYRAMSEDGTSTFGYASSMDGYHIDERLSYPIYRPTEPFEEKRVPGGNSGCEDPRIARIGSRLYMTYTAFNGVEPPRVALTSIALDDFLEHKWHWERPILISPPNLDDKDACLLSKKIGDKYIFFHRIGTNICIDAVHDLTFKNGVFLEGMTLFGPREDKWDNLKIGVCAPPIETPDGWLLLYHGVSEPGNIYKMGAALLDLENPVELITRADHPLLTPEMKYEREGQVPNVVFPCGAVVMQEKLFVYYGGADTVIALATVDLNELLGTLQHRRGK